MDRWIKEINKRTGCGIEGTFVIQCTLCGYKITYGKINDIVSAALLIANTEKREIGEIHQCHLPSEEYPRPKRPTKQYGVLEIVGVIPKELE